MGEIIGIKGISSNGSGDHHSVFAGSLDDLSRLIAVFSRVTEELYVSIGRKVQEYSVRASDITGQARNVSDILSGDELKNSMVGLGAMVDQFEEIFAAVKELSTSNLNALGAVTQKLKVTKKELESLAGTSRDLKMLALSTKIQSTKTGGDSAAFRQLGDDIAKMAVIISKKSGDLLAESKALEGIVTEADTSLADLKDEQAYQAENVLTWTRSIIESMARQSERSRNEAERIQRTSENITHSVSEMITSVQYQDISKQSLEKVMEELKKAEDPRSMEASDRADGKDALSGVPYEVGMTGMYLELLSRLEKTDLMVKDSLSWMIRSMEEIISDIERMMTISGLVYKESSGFLGDLEIAMSSITSFLGEVVQSSREMTDNMSSFGKTVEGMSRFIQDIEMISSEVELISLNARIMAAQAGVNGAGMGVIADAVKGTAVHSDDLRVAIVGRLNEILKTFDKFKGELKDTARGDEEKLDQLVRELGVFIDTLRLMLKNVLSILGEIDEQSGSLIKSIRSSIQDIHNHLQEDKVSEEISRKIKDLALNSTGFIDDGDLLNLAGDRLENSDPGSMDLHQRLELVRDFYNEHIVLNPAHEVKPGSEEEHDILIFDDNVRGERRKK